MNKHGEFVISFDFELYWGVRDKRALEDYKENLIGVNDAIPQMLELFKKYEIHATWGVVGFIFYNDINQLKLKLVSKKPEYTNSKLSPYKYIDGINSMDENERKMHFALPLIKLIASTENQEIATHTFSHYYCMEEGQGNEDFKEDLQMAISVATNYNIDLRSIIFPRNQCKNEYLNMCRKAGILAYRGNFKKWPYIITTENSKSNLQRALRLVDTYINIFGHKCFNIEEVKVSVPYNIKSSRFLRPYNKKLSPLEFLRLERIKGDMRYSAKNRLIYHLWCHPHNLGKNLIENLTFLEKILKYYSKLNKKYNYKSKNMKDITQELDNIKNQQ